MSSRLPGSSPQTPPCRRRGGGALSLRLCRRRGLHSCAGFLVIASPQGQPSCCLKNLNLRRQNTDCGGYVQDTYLFSNLGPEERQPWVSPWLFLYLVPLLFFPHFVFRSSIFQGTWKEIGEWAYVVNISQALFVPFLWKGDKIRIWACVQDR